MKTKQKKPYSYLLRCIFASLLVLLGVLLTQLVAMSFVQFGVITKLANKIDVKNFLITIVQQAIIFVLLAWWFQKKLDSSFFGFDGDLTLTTLFYGIVGLFGVNLFAGLVMKYVNVDIRQLEILDRHNMKQNSTIFLFIVAFIAPLYEEFVFRGVILKMLYSKAEEKLGSRSYTTIAILFSGALFSFVHFDIDAAFPVFILGCYFAWVTIQTNSIFLSSILHFVQNFLSGCLFLNQDLFKNLGIAFF